MKLPWMKFNPHDYLTGTGHLTLAQQGAYSRLLFTSWDGPLPLSLDDRARLLGVSRTQAAKLWRVIGRKFRKTNAGYVHPRVERDRAEALRKHDRNVRQARAAAHERWNADSNADRNADSIADRMPLAVASGQLAIRDRDRDREREREKEPNEILLSQNGSSDPSVDPRYALNPIEQMRRHLHSALHQALDADPDTDDGNLAEIVKNLSRPLGFYWNYGHEITSLIASVRGERARRVR